jgi:hypothetical protein
MEGAGGSSAVAATIVQQHSRDETWTEPRRPETPAQEAHRDSPPEVQTRSPPLPDYIRGPSAVHGDDAMDIGGVGVVKIVLSSPDSGGV